MCTLKSGDIIIEIKDGQVITPFNYKALAASGVWALYGKRTNDLTDTCLNVGVSTGKMGEEILYDIGCYSYFNYREDGSEPYINQFNDPCEFRYVDGQQIPYLYSYIAKHYNYIRFEYVSNQNTRDTEKKYAHEKHALYWRNGKPFGIKNR